MEWNWQQKDWPNFSYNKERLTEYEDEFFYNSGLVFGVSKYLDGKGRDDLKIQL